MNKLHFISIIILVSSYFSCFTAKDVDSNSRPISHQLFDSLLHQHVDLNGNVNYANIIKDSVLFNRYLELLQNNHPNNNNWNERERLCYWINAYNAFTIKLIIDHYPIASIKEIKKGIPFINSVFDIKFIRIENQLYDLNHIEHSILRARFDESRIHAAIVCASTSCPSLYNKAYQASTLYQDLETRMQLFVNDPMYNQISKDKVKISKIFYWFKGDFTTQGSLIDYLSKYHRTKIHPDAKVSYLDYDWGLNNQSLTAQ